jgi:hypothetical protein
VVSIQATIGTYRPAHKHAGAQRPLFGMSERAVVSSVGEPTVAHRVSSVQEEQRPGRLPPGWSGVRSKRSGPHVHGCQVTERDQPAACHVALGGTNGPRRSSLAPQAANGSADEKPEKPGRGEPDHAKRRKLAQVREPAMPSGTLRVCRLFGERVTTRAAVIVSGWQA